MMMEEQAHFVVLVEALENLAALPYQLEAAMLLAILEEAGDFARIETFGGLQKRAMRSMKQAIRVRYLNKF